MAGARADIVRICAHDARYRIGSIDVLAMLSLGPAQKVNTISTSGKDATKGIPVNLGSQIRQNRRNGLNAYVVLNKISRINFQNKAIEDTRFPEAERMQKLVLIN